ncbi:hypothetical protein OKW49_001927 [Paraburkholderia youngii]
MQSVANQRVESLRLWLSALNLGSVGRWQREAERATVRLVCFCPQFPAVGTDDGVGDREVNFRTASLGGVEGFEYPLAILRREAGARVADSDGWALRRVRSGADHGLGRIEDQINTTCRS